MNSPGSRTARAAARGPLLIALASLLLPACPARDKADRAGASASKPAPATAQARLDLPPELEKFRGVLQSSVKPFVRIAGKAGPTRPWESKFAGDPYFPRDGQYPRGADGKPMKLLAQINLAEVPDIGIFPRKGMLEFFLSTSDDAYGLDFDDPTSQRSFRVVYFDDVVQDPSRLMQDFRFVPAGAEGSFPIPKEARLSFAVDSAPVAFSDHRADTILKPGGWAFFDQFGKKADELRQAYDERFPGNGHKMGGYAFFTQDDPRSGKYGGYDVLLLQIDTDEALDIMWGDAGVANFFIREKDLKNRSFTDVLYNWDCY